MALSSASSRLSDPASGSLEKLKQGPMPYPNPRDETAWPGKGPIRTFEWVAGNRDQFWSQRAEDQGGVVFVGDSLIGGYPVGEAFPDLKVANRGIGGDVTRGLLFRLQDDVLELHPKAVVICYGSNDLGCGAEPQWVIENLELVIKQLRKSRQGLPIIICLVPPRDVQDAPLRAGSLEDLNSKITGLTEAYENLLVVDVFTPLATPNGEPRPEFFSVDKVHPNPAGYEKWTEVLRPALTHLGLK